MRKNPFNVLLCILALGAAGRTAGAAADFDPMRYGAKADGKALDTAAIQQAIDACAAKGGGTVHFDAGTYLAGTIDLRSHVTLYLEPGATLLGSANPKDYPERIVKTRSYTDNYVKQALIAGEGLEDIAIRGRGTIDGHGSQFKWKNYQNRPYGIRLVGCRDILIEDVNLRNSAMWMEHYLDCERLIVRGIRVFNHEACNGDGIDIDGCRDVTLEGCIIDSEDDALCFKSTLDRPCENITAINCVLASHCWGIKMGTESSGGFRNIAISNCTIQSPRKSKPVMGCQRGLGGVGLELVDGGQLENIAISNITIDGVESPIFMRLGNRARPYQAGMPKPPVGTLRHVVLSNIKAIHASPVGCAISGIPGHRIENVTLRDIRIECEGGGTGEDAARAIPEVEADYPENRMFGTLPAYGLYLRHVKGMTLQNVQVRALAPDARPAIGMDDALDVTIDGKKTEGALVAVASPATANSAAAAQAQEAEEVSITISNVPIHEMLSGVGASWHSILYPTVGHGGSAFGGSPPVLPRHEKLWASMEKHAEWLGLKFIRAEMDWRQFQPQPGQFTWQSPEMKVLDRVLSWSQRHGSDVMLQCMWVNAGWLAFPEYAGDPALEVNSAPADLDAFAQGWVALLRELREKRGYTCIRWINLVNEPYFWWLIPPGGQEHQDRARQKQYLAQAMQKVRLALAQANLPVKLMGPDITDLPFFEKLSAEPWFAAVDDVDFHSYCSCFDFEEPRSLTPWAYRLGERLDRTLVRYRAETAAAGKGLFLTEAGTQTYGFKGDNPAPGSFKASLKDTELLIRTLNLGIDGFNHWSFVNRGDLDGQWQLVDTWDPGAKAWLAEARPHRDAYYVLGLATRHMPQRAKVLASRVQGGQVEGLGRVWAAAVRSPRDHSTTVLIVNDAPQSWNAQIKCEGLSRPWASLCSDPKGEPKPAYQELQVNDGRSRLLLDPFSLTILTDAPLPADGAGRF